MIKQVVERDPIRTQSVYYETVALGQRTANHPSFLQRYENARIREMEKMPALGEEEIDENLEQPFIKPDNGLVRPIMSNDELIERNSNPIPGNASDPRRSQRRVAVDTPLILRNTELRSQRLY
jgi:hypothetical protein